MKINWRIVAESVVIMLGIIVWTLGGYIMYHTTVSPEWWPIWLENPWSLCYALGGTIMLIPWAIRVTFETSKKEAA